MQAAAAVAKDDPELIRRLPDTDGIPNELIIQKAQRFIYDHLYLTPGTKFVEIGDESGCSPEQLEEAITDNTVGIIHLESPFKNRGTVPLRGVVPVVEFTDGPTLRGATIPEIAPGKVGRALVEGKANVDGKADTKGHYTLGLAEAFW